MHAMHTRIVLVLATFLLVLWTVASIRLVVALTARHPPAAHAQRLAVPPPKKAAQTAGQPGQRDKEHAKEHRADDPPVYRLDFTLMSEGAGHAMAMSAYTLNLAEHDKGAIHVATNMPIAMSTNGAASARMDVGLTLECDYSMVGNDLLLRESEEMTRIEQGSAIRKLSAHGDALVTPGKPALVASIDDPSGQLRYLVNVTATRLR
jgi:hypothetical protein